MYKPVSRTFNIDWKRFPKHPRKVRIWFSFISMMIYCLLWSITDVYIFLLCRFWSFTLRTCITWWVFWKQSLLRLLLSWVRQHLIPIFLVSMSHIIIAATRSHIEGVIWMKWVQVLGTSGAHGLMVDWASLKVRSESQWVMFGLGIVGYPSKVTID